MRRPWLATGLVALCVVAAVIVVAGPAWQAYDTKTQGQKLANEVLALCGLGGDAAAPLVAAGACPLARQVSASTVPAAQGVTPEQVQVMINEAIARQKAPPPPVIMPDGGGPLNPSVPPGAAGPPGREQYTPQPAPEEQRVQSTEEARPPRPPRQFQLPSSDRGVERRPPERTTVTEAAPSPATVTEQAPVTETVQAPAPAAPVVEQPQQQGVPLLNGVGGLLNGLGNGL